MVNSLHGQGIKEPGIRVIIDGYANDGTPEALSKLLDDHNISGDCHFSSSMDFADEYGFAHYDGAKVLWEQMNEFRMSFGSEEGDDYRAKVRG